MNTTMTYDLTVTPYNYMKPRIVFPAEGAKLRLSKESANPGMNLLYTNGEKLDLFSAEDDDGLEAGIVTFQIYGPGTTYDNYAYELSL